MDICINDNSLNQPRCIEVHVPSTKSMNSCVGALGLSVLSPFLRFVNYNFCSEHLVFLCFSFYSKASSALSRWSGLMGKKTYYLDKISNRPLVVDKLNKLMLSSTD